MFRNALRAFATAAIVAAALFGGATPGNATTTAVAACETTFEAASLKVVNGKLQIDKGDLVELSLTDCEAKKYVVTRSYLNGRLYATRRFHTENYLTYYASTWFPKIGNWRYTISSSTTATGPISKPFVTINLRVVAPKATPAPPVAP